MPIDKSGAAKLREAQERKSWQRTCSLCVRQFYDSLIGPCPDRDGRQVCMYCCRMCGQSYFTGMGWGCRAKEKKKGRTT